MSSIARYLSGVPAPTARQWLSVLETGQIVRLLPPFHRNLGKRIRNLWTV